MNDLRDAGIRMWEALIRFVVPVGVVVVLFFGCPSMPRARPIKPPPDPKPAPPPVSLREIRFDFARDELTRASERILDDNLRLLRNSGSPRVKIEGHCDARGDDTYNDALAARRATRARNYLVDRGYEAERLDVAAAGKRKPRCTAAEEKCWETNRRAEFEVLR